MTANAIGDGCEAERRTVSPLLLPLAAAVAFQVSGACHVAVVVMVT